MDELADDRDAFVFEAADGATFAISLLEDGSNLPETITWTLVESFRLGVRETLPVDLPPEPVLRGIAARGYYVWHTPRILPFGTSQ